MICPVCKKYFCALKSMNDYNISFCREIFRCTPKQLIEIPENVTEVTCPNCKHDVKIEKGVNIYEQD